MHLVEKARDRVLRDGHTDLLEDLGDLLRRLAGPLQPGDGISCGIVLQQNLDGIDLFRAFFFHGLAPRPGSACAVHFHVLS